MSYQWQYGIIFTGQNYVGPAVAEVTENLATLQGQVLNLNQSLQQTDFISTRGFRNMIFGAQMSLFYFSMIESGMMRTESATIGVEMAQDHYNETVKKFGPNSKEAERALNSLERSQIMMQRMTTYTNIMFVAMGLQMVNMAATIQQYALPQLITLAHTLYGVAAAGYAALASMGPYGWAAIATGLAATAYAAYRITTFEAPTTIDVNTTTDLDAALEAYKQRLKRAITVAGS